LEICYFYDVRIYVESLFVTLLCARSGSVLQHLQLPESQQRSRKSTYFVCCVLWVCQHRCNHLPIPNLYPILTAGSPGKAETP